MVAGCTLAASATGYGSRRSRLTALVVDSVDQQGVTNEQAVFYQYYNYSGYRGRSGPPAALRIRGARRRLRRIDRMPSFLAHATLPDGTYVMLGDTVRRSAASIAGTHGEFAASAGGAWAAADGIFARYRRRVRVRQHRMGRAPRLPRRGRCTAFVSGRAGVSTAMPSTDPSRCTPTGSG